MPYHGQVYGTSTLLKASDTSVDLTSTAEGTTVSPLLGVVVSDGGNGKIILTYSDPSGTLTGNIINSSLNMTLKSGTSTLKLSGVKH